VVVGASLRDGTGAVEAIPRVRAACPGAAVVVFAATLDRQHVLACVDAGADGYQPLGIGP
jgi:DNA-binding NarL/FixJ family response regulator